MPMNWIEEQALQNRKILGVSESGTPSERIVTGRVLRVGERPATDGMSYWDIVILGNGNQELDVSRGAARPVRPYVSNVGVSSNMTVSVGSIVSVKIRSGANRINHSVETGEGAEDYVETAPGRHFVIGGGGGGSCYQGATEWGVLFG